MELQEGWKELDLWREASNEDWDAKIRASKNFLILADEGYFGDAVCACQAQYAKDLKKPFLILIKRGVKIPDGFLDGIDNYQIEEWESVKEILSLIAKLLRHKDELVMV